MNKIYISIASYRDPQLLPTLRDCINNAHHPENLVFGIAWQHNPDDDWDNLDEFKEDPRFKIIDINYKDSQGACWARYLIHQQYNNEKYYLQLDSHHRFIKGWDTECINMLNQLQSQGYKKPLLTAYISSFNPDNDPEERIQEPWWMTFDRFIPEGAIFFLPATIPGWEDMTSPLPSRFLSAHFIFTLGQWCKEVTYDPDYYFHGEEISLAVRSYTAGYDLFHPHKVIAWHEYTRKGRSKQWDDVLDWGKRNDFCHKKNRALFRMDNESREGMNFEGFDFGTVRTLEDYEKYSGISFKNRAIQRYTKENNFAPNPIIDDYKKYENSFLKIFKHCIDIGFNQVPLDDYDFWVVAFENSEGETIYRVDAEPSEIQQAKNDPEGYCKIWREFECEDRPRKWVVWPHSLSQGWCEKIEGILP